MKNSPAPIKEIDLDKLSVSELIQMLERGDEWAKFIMMSLRAAEARGKKS